VNETGERYDRVLAESTAALQRADVHHALIGGIAAAFYGLHPPGRDIDIFADPSDAPRTREALAGAGFKVGRGDPPRTVSASRDGVTVEVVFEAAGSMRFDRECQAHVVEGEYHGRRLRVLGREDLLIMKANRFGGGQPQHWFDAVGLVIPELDWEYLVRRARPLARPVLSLLLWAQAQGRSVPDQTVVDLFEAIFGGETPRPVEEPADADRRLAARIHERLAADPRVSAPELEVSIRGGKVVITGVVATEERRSAISALVDELVGPGRAENRTRVLPMREPKKERLK